MSALTDLELKYKTMEASLLGQIYKGNQEYIRSQYYSHREIKNLYKRINYLEEQNKKLQAELDKALIKN